MNIQKFTVLMSVYVKDKLNYFEEALNSVLNNSFVPNEIVIVFDGDVSSEIEKYVITQQINYRNSIDIKIVRLSQNLGLGLALRTGFQYCTNDLIARVDADDINYLNRFEKQITFMKTHPKISVLGAGIEEFSESDKTVNTQRIVLSTKYKIKKFAKFRSPFNHPTVIFKKKVIEQIGGYQNFKGLEDYHLWGRLMMSEFDYDNLPDTLVKMRTGFYGRRGGAAYLKKYIQLRKYLVKIGLTTKSNAMFCIILMTISANVPTFCRKLLYTKVLRK